MRGQVVDEKRSDVTAAGTSSPLVRLAAASGCSMGAEGLLEVVLGVWAYQAGGPGLVSLVAALLFFPAAFSTPAIMVMAERSPRREVILHPRHREEPPRESRSHDEQ